MKIHPKTQKINCTVLKKIIGGACPRTPLAMRMALTCKFPNLKNNSWPLSPLPNPGDAPVFLHFKRNLQILAIV